MKTNVVVYTLCLILFLHSPLQAQAPEEPPQARLHKLGATIGIGAANMDLRAINNRLQELEIGRLEESLTTFNFSIYTEIYSGIGASFDVSSGLAFDSFTQDPHASLRFTTLTVGATLYYSLLNTNRVRFQILAGPRLNDMRLQYNADTRASPDLNDLLTDPAANSNAIALESVATDETANVGVRLQYRLGKKENIKPREYTIGIDSGYNISFSDVLWREALSNNAVQNMPVIKPDHFYLNFTFSAFLLR